MIAEGIASDATPHVALKADFLLVLVSFAVVHEMIFGHASRLVV